jgi:serine/threonine protein kinase
MLRRHGQNDRHQARHYLRDQRWVTAGLYDNVFHSTDGGHAALDARFEELYNRGPAVLPHSKTPSAGVSPGRADKDPKPFTRAPSPTDSASSSNFAVEETVATNVTAVPAQSPGSSGSATNASQYDRSMTGESQDKPTLESSVSDTQMISSTNSHQGDRDGPAPSHLQGQASEKKTKTSSATSDASSDSFVTVLAIVGTVLVLAMGVVGYRVRVGARRKQDAAAYDNLESPLSIDYAMAVPRDPTPTAVQDPEQYLEHDIRTDRALQAYRLNAAAIQLGDAVTQGGAYVLYRGVFRGQTVAVKQMAQDTWRDEANVARFMDEIRICLSLHHPQLVRCLGMSWTSVRDLSVVTEYMAGGDLRAFLESQSDEPTGREWSESWSVSRIKSKTSIATDVAQALAHLHTREIPVLHRDLRAKLVLLDLPGNAKLSGFGIGRSGTVDEAASREAGAVAWIAPEVLRGERFTAKADMYSFGVLLVELDRCRHPYAHEPVLASHEKNARTTTMMWNTRIAIMVSTGKLRPLPSPSCPDRVKQVILRCLALDAADRPTAMEVADTLNAIGREIGAK